MLTNGGVVSHSTRTPAATAETRTLSYLKYGFYVITCCAWACTAAGKYGGGTGQANEPYLIYSGSDLYTLSTSPVDWHKHFKLMADIDLSGPDCPVQPAFSPIGYQQWNPFETKPFTGVFDGNGRRISNLKYRCDSADNVGLFGYVDGPDAQIKDVWLVNVDVNAAAGRYVGALVGKLNAGSVTGCLLTGGAVIGGNFVGGLVGYNFNGIISDCHVSGSVAGGIDTGGLVGYQHYRPLSNCSFSGHVQGEDAVGGLAGENNGRISGCFSKGRAVALTGSAAGLVGANRGQLHFCYSTSDVVAAGAAGGLVAKNAGSVANCYARGSVSGVSYVGGLTALQYQHGSISNCYAAGTVSTSQDGAGGLAGWFTGNLLHACFCLSDQPGSGPDAGVLEISTEQMKLRDSFITAGWDFVGETENGSKDIWDICEGTNYPRLAWQSVVGADFACPDGVDELDLAVLSEDWLLAKLTADVGPRCGDGWIDFGDWAVFALGWHSRPGMANWNPRCDIAPKGGDGFVGPGDLTLFLHRWLAAGVVRTDLFPAAADGAIDFVDWAIFSQAWQSRPGAAGWNPRCDIAPDGGDGVVDMQDIALVLRQWTQTGVQQLRADIAPEGRPDGKVNMLDFTLLASRWLEGM